MTCPSCQIEPLTRSQYIWKPQVMTLTCSRCGTKLRMAPATTKAAVGLVVGLALCVMIAAFVVFYTALKDGLLSDSPGGAAAVMIACIVAFSVLGAILVRRVLWNKPYMADTRTRSAAV